MPSSSRLAVVLALLAFSMLPFRPLGVAAETPHKSYAIVNIDRIGHEALQALQATPGLDWWVELDDQLLVFGPDAVLLGIAATRPTRLLDVPVEPSSLRIVQRLHGDDALESGVRVLARAANAAVIQASPRQLRRLERHHAGHGGPYEVHARPMPFIPNIVLARQAANREGIPTPEFDVSIQTLVDSVDGNRWFSDVQTLANFGTRKTGTSGCINARDWLVSQFQAMPGLTVETQSFAVGANTGYNVIATLPGTTRPDDWYIVGGHYDSIPSTGNAPGAEDNGSGTAGVLELARIFTEHPPEATIKFICYSGEEQGLYGSTHHATQLVNTGDNAKVEAMLNMDMIGYTGDSDLDILLETGSIGQFLIDAFSAAAAEYTTLRVVTSLNPFGSDHVPYLNRGMPALLTIENDYSTYPHYHRATDTPDRLTMDMAVQTLRMNVGALADMVGDPEPTQGADTAGVYDSATAIWYLRNSNSDGPANIQFVYGPSGLGWMPITGDWNSDGIDTVGLYDPSTGVFYLRNSNTSGPADLQFVYGPGGAGWVPFAGDWDGNGTDTVGLYNPSNGVFYLRNSNTSGSADLQFPYGPIGATPLVGDWDGNGTTTVGVFTASNSVFHLRNTNNAGPANMTYQYGPPASGWTPIMGDWNGENTHTAGLYEGSTGLWRLRNSNTAGPAHMTFPYGPVGSTIVPIRGDWNNL